VIILRSLQKKIKTEDFSSFAIDSKKTKNSNEIQNHGLFVGKGGTEVEELKRKKELEQLRSQDPRKLGLGAATVYRDSKGRPLAMLNQMMAGPGYQGEEQNMAWGVGEIDEDKKRKEQEENDEESKRGFHAVYAEDLKNDQELQSKDRFGDPMAYMLKKKSKTRVFQGAYPANRFNIPPGWRWDGIDRSNGFESSIFKAQNEKKAYAEAEMHYAQDEM